MAAVFELVFDLFIVLYREESRYTPLDLRKEDARHHFVSSARRSIADLASLSTVFFLLYTRLIYC